jgi:hypothetical protein
MFYLQDHAIHLFSVSSNNSSARREPTGKVSHSCNFTFFYLCVNNFITRIKEREHFGRVQTSLIINTEYKLYHSGHGNNLGFALRTQKDDFWKKKKNPTQSFVNMRHSS